MLITHTQTHPSEMYVSCCLLQDTEFRWYASFNRRGFLEKLLCFPRSFRSLQIHPQTIWTYSIQLWGTASTSNIEILERFQSKAPRIIVDALWYVPNSHILQDLQLISVKEEICRYSYQYCTRFTTHPNEQILTLMELPGNRRLRTHLPNDLPNRFLL
jgi:hypothetical protein